MYLGSFFITIKKNDCQILLNKIHFKCQLTSTKMLPIFLLATVLIIRESNFNKIPYYKKLTIFTMDCRGLCTNIRIDVQSINNPTAAKDITPEKQAKKSFVLEEIYLDFLLL